jgi:hypothetical protein
VASFVLWQQRQPKLAGFWLGLAVLLKVTPMLLVIWFVLKRQFRVVGVALATVLLAGPAADVVVFRPAYAASVYQRWFQVAVTEGSQRGLILAQKEMDWRNQGLGAVASRWLHPTNYATHFDNDPRIKMNKPLATMNVLELSRATVATAVMLVMGLSIAALLWLARRPARELNLWQLRLEWALFILAMLWLMPVLRRYHLILLLPAVALLASGIHYAGRQRRWSKLALACIGSVFFCELSLLTRVLPELWIVRLLGGILGAERLAALSRAFDAGLLEASGVLLLPVVLLAIAIVALLLRLTREPNALPAPAYAAAHPARPGQSPGGDAPLATGTVAAGV